MGLSEVLISLPEDDRRYTELLTNYRNILKKVFGCQNSDGSFSERLLDNDSNPDSSATSMIAWSCAKTIEQGVIDDDYLANCFAAFDFIVSVTDRDGKVMSCSGEALGVNRYASNISWDPWRQGPALSLAAVLLRIQSARNRFNPQRSPV